MMMRLPTKLLPASQILSIPHYPTRLRFHTKPTRFAASLQQLDVKRLTATQLARTGALNGTQKTSSKQPKSFAELLERGDVLAAVAEAGFAAPTEIQEKGIPAIKKRKDVALASHTGSGKTLSYLLPLLELLKNQEERDGVESKMKRPRAIVLGPTRELTDQILHVSKSLSHHVKFRSVLLNAGGRLKQQKQKLAMPQDLVIATPSRLNEHIKDRSMFFGDVQFLVLDEADTMFDAGFGPEVMKIVEVLRAKPLHCQFILIGATMGKEVKKMIGQTFKDINVVETRSLHKGAPGSRHRFLSLQPGLDKITQLHQLLSADSQASRKAMVFCNTMDSCRAIEHTLSELGVQTLCYHGDMPIDQRKETMKAFSGTDQDSVSPGFLVCTDLAARGLDISGAVDHVINFDFPKSPIDYIHRSGRTARAGAPGRVTSLIGGKDRVLADRIEWALSHGLPLDELSSKKTNKPPSMRTNTKQEGRKQPRRPRENMKGLRGAARATAMSTTTKNATVQKEKARKVSRARSESRRKQIMASGRK